MLMKKPLDGYRVVELGTHVAVPIAGRMMADWGADVIKVEPLKGEPWRTIGDSYGVPCFPGHNPLFQTENANKRAIALDLKLPEGFEVFMKLLKTADVFMTNTRLRSLQKLKLDYGSVKSVLPKLIYGHMSGFGVNGRDSERPGFDVAAFWARGGMPVEWSRKEYPPFKPQAGFGDTVSGSLLLGGLLAALLAREKTGAGDYIQISLYGSAIWCNNTGIVSVQPRYGLTFPRGKEDFPAPYSPLYRTKNGDWFMWSLPDWDKRYKEILRILRIERYTDDPRFVSLENAGAHVGELIDIFAEAFAEIETEELVRKLTEGDFVFERMANTEDVCSDEQAWANGYLRRAALEDGAEVILPENPVSFGSFKTSFRLAPKIGENTREIMDELGYGKPEIEELLSDGCAK